MYLIFQVCPSNATTCSVCHTKISYKSLRVTKKPYSGSCLHYHLHCIRPDALVPMKFEEFSLHQVTEEQIKDLRGRIDVWNRQFLVSEDQVPMQFLAKAVTTTSTLARRRLLETFAYLSIPELEKSVSLICKEWFHVTRDEELWKSRFVVEFHPTDTDSDGQYRRKYISCYLSACWRCKAVLNSDTIDKKCPIFKRPLCRQCAKSSDCRVVTLRSYMAFKDIQKGTLEFLQVPWFVQSNARSSYVKLLAEKMIPYAERRKRVLIEAVSDRYVERVVDGEIRAVRELDLKKFYRGELFMLSPVQRLAVVYFGKNEKNEKKDKNVEMFVREVENKRFEK